MQRRDQLLLGTRLRHQTQSRQTIQPITRVLRTKPATFSQSQVEMRYWQIDCTGISATQSVQVSRHRLHMASAAGARRGHPKVRTPPGAINAPAKNAVTHPRSRRYQPRCPVHLTTAADRWIRSSTFRELTQDARQCLIELKRCKLFPTAPLYWWWSKQRITPKWSRKINPQLPWTPFSTTAISKPSAQQGSIRSKTESVTIGWSLAWFELNRQVSADWFDCAVPRTTTRHASWVEARAPLMPNQDRLVRVNAVKVSGVGIRASRLKLDTSSNRKLISYSTYPTNCTARTIASTVISESWFKNWIPCNRTCSIWTIKPFTSYTTRKFHTSISCTVTLCWVDVGSWTVTSQLVGGVRAVAALTVAEVWRVAGGIVWDGVEWCDSRCTVNYRTFKEGSQGGSGERTRERSEKWLASADLKWFWGGGADCDWVSGD